MILMSEGLVDRVVLEHNEENAPDDNQIISESENLDFSDQKAIVQFNIGNEAVRCTVKKMTLSIDNIAITFVAVPSLPLRLRENLPILCILSCGSHVLEFNLKSFDATWDNMEGKQLCTIISKIEQHARSSE